MWKSPSLFIVLLVLCSVALSIPDTHVDRRKRRILFRRHGEGVEDDADSSDIVIETYPVEPE
jgi:hypothetical protein